MVLFFIVFSPTLVFSQALDPRFHTWPEIQAFLDSLDQDPNYETLFRVDTIGYSTQEQLPILAAKISDNVTLKEDEPRVLFLGQCHAEEVLGVEAVLRLIELLLAPPPDLVQHVNVLRMNLEIWIVPTYNPEGLNVVHQGLDVSYRKNKHDFSPEGPWPNGVFDYDPSIGNDIDGVDLNRNYDFNWVLGDTFLEPDPSDYGAHYDYYRGPAPWSESEVRAIRDLALENDFVFSIAWHSSRSGRFSEKVIMPWSWGDNKQPPDHDIILTIGTEVANLIVRENSTDSYQPILGGSRNGKAHDWFYAATGCFQYLIECGTANLQPDSALIEDTIERLLPGMFYLLDRTIGYDADAAQLTGTVENVFGEPLEGVKVTIVELQGGVQSPRLTDEFGRFRRILLPGSYTLRLEKFGYTTRELVLVANNSTVENQVIILNPAPQYNLGLELINESGFTPDQSPRCILKNDLTTDTLTLTPGMNVIPWPAGTWQVTVLWDTLMPWVRTVHLSEDQDYMVNGLIPDQAQLAFADTTLWPIRVGTWVVENDTLRTQAGFLYSNGDSTSDAMVYESQWLPVVGSNRVVVEWSQRYEVEWDYDSVVVQVWRSPDSLGGRWAASQHNWSTFHKERIGIQDTSGLDSVKVRLIFSRDESVNYRGWVLGSLRVLWGHDPYLGIVEKTPPYSLQTGGELSLVYPNPSSGTLALDLYRMQAPVTITLYNLLGQQIYQETLEKLSHPRQTWRLDLLHTLPIQLSSGVYFLRIVNPEKTFVRKCAYLRP
ncbi:MAG: M14 family zinc carboxypeptidase [Fidelibacterota bacterium]